MAGQLLPPWNIRRFLKRPGGNWYWARISPGPLLGDPSGCVSSNGPGCRALETRGNGWTSVSRVATKSERAEGFGKIWIWELKIQIPYELASRCYNFGARIRHLNHSHDHRFAAELLGGIFEMAVEISSRGGCRAA